MLHEKNKGEAWFESGTGLRIGRTIMRSLDDKKKVHGDVIDGWAEVLNAEEWNKHVEGERNIYFGHRTLTDCIVNGDMISEDDRVMMFNKKMKEVVGGKDANGGLLRYNMAFFPILENDHHYLIVFSLKTPDVAVIDNMNEICSSVTYKNHPEFARKSTPYKANEVVVKYLEEWKHPNAAQLRAVDVHRVDLDWETIDNEIDCGVFFMRHMECYVGPNHEDFHGGFTVEEAKMTKEIKVLRKRYAAKMVLSDVNLKNRMVLSEVV